MRKIINQLVLILLFTSSSYTQINNCKLEKAVSFFPQYDELNQGDIKWFYLSVPENWEKPGGKKIKLAVAILSNTSKNKVSNPVVYLEGGPGGSGIEGIWSWIEHPIREKSDIVLVDVRGTGNSLPKFCPDLGKQFLEILSKNQSATQDEYQKIMAAMACKQDLITRDIDLDAYNSKSIAQDLNALKTVLKYEKWNVYGASYGTYIAQVYSNNYPNDIKSLLLDSSISDITKYYNNNTTNYMSSLSKVFEACENDPNCNKQFPNLEQVYFETIDKLNKAPITVKVDKKIISKGQFTYNSEDFKVAIQQGLYNKKLIEVIPLLIYEFNRANKATLSSLVAAFSGSLSLDYGQYYCVSCNEVIPNNSLESFNKDAQKYKKLRGGLSFYKSDFLVCDKWNSGTNNKKVLNDLSNLSSLQSPVIVFSGEFDPITPVSNGRITSSKFQKGYLINAPVYGHVSSFSKYGFKIVNDFIQNPNIKPDTKELMADNEMHFVTDVEVNGGVSNFGNSLNEFNVVFFAPLFIAILVLLVTIFSFIFGFIKRKKNDEKVLKAFILLTSIVGLFIIVQLALALNNTAQNNFYILAFGLPNQHAYLFQLQWIFLVLALISVVYFFIKIKSISDPSIIGTILFSIILVGAYFQYWGFFY